MLSLLPLLETRPTHGRCLDSLDPPCLDDLGFLRFESFHSPHSTLYSLHPSFDVGHEVSIANYPFFIPFAHNSLTPGSELRNLCLLCKLGGLQALHPGQKGDKLRGQGRIGNWRVRGYCRQGRNCAGKCGCKRENRRADSCRIELAGGRCVGGGRGCEECRMTAVCITVIRISTKEKS